MSIEVKNATKNFKDVAALSGINVKFEQGKIYGLLGRNGAGKTTLIKALGNYSFLTEGEINIDGVAIGSESVSGKVHAMLEDDFFPEGMKVKEAFASAKDFYPEFDSNVANELCEKFGLKGNKKIKSLSTGYKSIFKFIYAISTNAAYVFLDEPVLGLDANHRDLLYKTVIERYAECGNTIVISTHLIGEAASLIEDVVIINKGKVLTAMNKEELLSGGYAVSGVASKVDEYVLGKTVLGTEGIGGLKTAYVMGQPQDVPDGLEVSPLDLQKLFIEMTNDTKEM